MRILVAFLFMMIVAGCNSSGNKKSKEAMDDTARMDNPPPAQKIDPVKGTSADIPKSINVPGIVDQVWTWSDNAGKYLLIESTKDIYKEKGTESGDPENSGELYAALYLVKDSDYSPVWTMSDSEKDCQFDITCAFVKDATSITDLDADGTAEITLIYRLACRSDVSPAEMKLVMYEGKDKYMLKGFTWYGSPEDKFEVTEANANLETLPGYKKTEEEFMKTWGRYESEKEFTGAPPEFLSHARNRWIRFVKEGGE